MAKDKPTEIKTKSTELPQPETLKPQEDNTSPDVAVNTTIGKQKASKLARHVTYRPSHKATFIGLGIVVLILVINAGVIAFILRGQSSTSSEVSLGGVKISPAVLDTLGVNKTAVGNLGTELVVNPNSKFAGKVTVGGDVNIAGQLTLNSKFSASDASLTKLEAGDTSLAKLNVNGDGTISNLNLRNNLIVVGSTTLQGAVNISQLLTVNNNLNVTGNLAVGGTLSARGFQASSLVSDTTLTIGGHVITRGSAPTISAGNGLGSNGTVSISGNDASGTLGINIGVGCNGGMLAYVSFKSPYSNTPHVVVTAIGGPGMGTLYVSRSAAGFTVGANGSIPPGGYAIDYIVMQ